MTYTSAQNTNEAVERFINVNICDGCENCSWCDLDAKVSCACRALELDGFRLVDLVDEHYGEYLLVELYIERCRVNMASDELDRQSFGKLDADEIRYSPDGYEVFWSPDENSWMI